ncbi:uncharacterized protein LOC132053934 [Lycium ferocissimum]|uniref:uncharacterized protein LOC132053934 n=1 Tax=Lycium ferocissimum TaxID=112874 RepID=UPI00281641FF|nr:uncharacterized protein LOC132053934 [Lycium ferocissimum]
MKPKEFTGTDPDADPQNFIDELQKIFRVMQATDKEVVEFGTFQLKDVAHLCQGGGGRPFQKGKSAGPATSAANAPVPKFRNDLKNRNSGAAGSQSQFSIGNKGFQHSVCVKCNKRHPGVCRSGMDGCFGCGQPGHFLRDYPSAKPGNVAQSTSSVATRASQAQSRRGVANSGNTGLMYALASR